MTTNHIFFWWIMLAGCGLVWFFIDTLCSAWWAYVLFLMPQQQIISSFFPFRVESIYDWTFEFEVINIISYAMEWKPFWPKTSLCEKTRLHKISMTRIDKFCQKLDKDWGLKFVSSSSDTYLLTYLRILFSPNFLHQYYMIFRLVYVGQHKQV